MTTMTLTTQELKCFSELKIDPKIFQAIQILGYDKPTDVQAQAIPLALNGKDILASAPTGTGKTAAFSIPMLQWLHDNPNGKALIITPTRELASQVTSCVSKLTSTKPINTVLLIGGEVFFKQHKKLKTNPRIIIGTPGRINDHLNRNSAMLANVGFIVLDETDRMLDIGFREQIETILKTTNENKQTLLFSATIPKNILQLASSYLSNPERISVGKPHVPVDHISQENINTSENMKYKNLIEQLEKNTGSVIVFAKTKIGCDELADTLNDDGYSAKAIHGDLKQHQRNNVIRDFRSQKFKILIATDVAARGIDIPHIECVINFDLPQNPTDYIHRIGRTGRAGAQGKAVNFITKQDSKKWQGICRFVKTSEVDEDNHRENGSRRFGSRQSFSKDRPSFAKDRPSFAKDRPYRSSFRDEGYSSERNSDKNGERPRRFSRESTPSKDNSSRSRRPFNNDRADNRGEKRFAPKRRREYETA